MKKYKITFVTDYYELSKNKTDFYQKVCRDAPDKVKFCKKWHNKSITFKELEDNIDEFGSVIFDGNTFKVYNDWNE